MNYFKLFEGKQEINTPEVDEFLLKIEVQFLKHFPNGYFQASVAKSFGTSISIYCGMIAEKKDCPSNIRQNDPMWHFIKIWDDSTGDFTDKVLRMEALNSRLSINPEPGTNFAMGHVNTKFRKSKGDLAKALKTLTTFFGRLAKLVIENKENIYNGNQLDPKYMKIK